MKQFIHKNLNLLVACVIVFVLGMTYTTWALNTNAAAQRRQGQLTEQKLCQTLDTFAANKPPSGNPATNPSQAYEQNEHRDFIQLGEDLGCM